ncbi:MAG: class V aminotransferase [Candidatus Syntrophoarchaeum caldarius]|uniref:Class V aminotransferase n=1 Tax=Candidatus Syntropharchaeum caldarium TaxID=1838285 RepID=A0A1F2P9N5_9EURY|nr:MAG: class V aminotransferase [Candidatus Syntrophoarchaeum caldarius]
MDLEDEIIMLPGPVPVAPRILRAMSRPMINHRGEEFKEIFGRIEKGLKEIMQTENDVFVLSGSGSCAMEAAISNIIKNEKILTIVNGKFGDRFHEIAKRYGDPVPLEYEWGDPIEPDDVRRIVEEEKDLKAVAMVHNETSAGITNPAPEIAEIARENDLLFIMDGVTSIGGIDVRVDEWGVDIAVLGSQKCLGMPPGLSMISVSERAMDRMVESPPLYMDLKAYKKSADKGQTPYTPALPLFYALDEAINIVMEEGVDARIRRHTHLASMVRDAVKEWGLELFPRLNDVSRYSNTVTAIKMPEGISADELRSRAKKMGVVIAGGQERLKGKIFRIGTMGNIREKDVLMVLEVVERVLRG